MTYDIIAIIGTSDQSCWLAEAFKLLLLQSDFGSTSFWVNPNTLHSSDHGRIHGIGRDLTAGLLCLDSEAPPALQLVASV